MALQVVLTRLQSQLVSHKIKKAMTPVNKGREQIINIDKERNLLHDRLVASYNRRGYILYNKRLYVKGAVSPF